MIEEIRSKYSESKAQFYQTDITDEAAVKDLFGSIKEEFGRVDVLYNNAGIDLVGPTHEFSFEDWNQTIAVNLSAVFLMSKEAIKLMLDSGGGAIVSTASTAAHVGVKNHVTYNAVKHGVVGITKSLAVEYSGRNIRVNAVSPGDTETPLLDVYSEEEMDEIIAGHPIGRLG